METFQSLCALLLERMTFNLRCLALSKDGSSCLDGLWKKQTFKVYC